MARQVVGIMHVMLSEAKYVHFRLFFSQGGITVNSKVYLILDLSEAENVSNAETLY